MNIEKLLDLTLREILAKYCAVFNPECGFYYGIFKVEDIDRVFKEYNIQEDYPEAFDVESIIPIDLWDASDEVRDWDTLERIMGNLGISKKEE